MQKSTVALLLLLAACSPSAQPDKKEAKDTGPGVSLEADDVKALGIQTVPLRAAAFQRQVAGYGVVTPLDTIAQSDADYMTASAAAAQSGAAAARARSLGTGEEAAVSREVVEAAQSAPAPQPAASASYFVAAHSLPAGTFVRDEDFELRAGSTGKLPEGAILDTADARIQLRGSLVRLFIDAGHPITAKDVLRPRDRGPR